MSRPILAGCLLALLSSIQSSRAAESPEMAFVRVADDKRTFALVAPGGGVSGRFTPWGLNYDHDEKGRLIEDYWDAEWDKVREDFREMRELGANVVRVHLQLGRFLRAADKSDDAALARLGKLVALAEELGLYLDLTGLGCYHKKDVPDWYDRLGEKERWNVQARFWEAVSARCAKSPAIFCYDLMNEPVVSAGPKKTDWLGPAFAGKHFVQYITLDQAGRDRPTVARQWIVQLAAAIRKHDRRHLITVGLVPWSLDRPGLSSGFVPEKIAAELDFVSVHVYPEKGKLDDALATLKGFAVGKPVVVEETFPLACTADEWKRFHAKSAGVASGWMGFYWGKTPAECRPSKEIADAMMLAWLEAFSDLAPRTGR